jgi:DNA repair protein RadC
VADVLAHRVIPGGEPLQSIAGPSLIARRNYPGGLAEPSQSDLRITQRLKDALALVDARVLDHHIVGDGEGTSLAERGLL